MEAKGLSPDTARRLAKVLGKLGSDSDGERAAAALHAHRLVTQAGLNWDQVVVGVPSWNGPEAALLDELETISLAVRGWRKGEIPSHVIKAEKVLAILGDGWTGNILSSSEHKFLRHVRVSRTMDLPPDEVRRLNELVARARTVGQRLAKAKERHRRKQAADAARRQREYRERHPRPRKPPVETTCAECGGPMVARRSTRRFCSATCRSRAHLRAKGDAGRRAA